MWYRTGTCSVTNGSTAVTGSGTAWIANAGIGEALLAPDGKLYEIANIASDTSITLGSNYLGATQYAQAYVIVPSQSYIRDLASQAATLVNSYSTLNSTVGQGRFSDGALATPGISFSGDQDTGLFRSAANEVTLVANGVAIAKWSPTGFALLSGGLDGGTIDGTVIGGTTPAAGSFTTLSSTGVFSVGTGNRTLSYSGGSAKIKNVPADGAWANFYSFEAASSALSLGAFGAYGGTKDTSDYVYIAAQDQDYSSSTVKVTSNSLSVTGTLYAYTPYSGATPGVKDYTQLVIGSGNNDTTGGTESSIIKAAFNTGGEIGAYIAAKYNLFAGSTTSLTFATRAGPGDPVERMRIDYAGNVGIGTTAVSAKIHTKTVGTTDTALLVQSANASFGGLQVYSTSQAAAGTSWYHFYGTSSGGAVEDIKIYGNGNITNANNSYGALSDLKLKQDVVGCTPKLDKLNQVRVVNYRLKSDPDHKQLGVIAQELEQIFPGMIEESPDYIEVKKTRIVDVPAVFEDRIISDGSDEIVDEDGNVIQEAVDVVTEQVEVTPATTREEEYTEREATGEFTKSVKYSVFVPMLIKAIQEQSAIITAMEARLAALEAA